MSNVDGCKRFQLFILRGGKMVAFKSIKGVNTPLPLPLDFYVCVFACESVKECPLRSPKWLVRSTIFKEV